jgi:carboxymethylenebutenolidase
MAIFVFLAISLIPAHAAQFADIHMHDYVQFVAESPRSQFMSDVPANMIQCPDGLEIIMKKSNGVPACVKPSTIPILIERGWGIHVLPDYNKDGENNSDMIINL